jgi:hypothetical protein
MTPSGFWSRLAAAHALAVEARSCLPAWRDGERALALLDERAGHVDAVLQAVEALRQAPVAMPADEQRRLLAALEVARAETRDLETLLAAEMDLVRGELRELQRTATAGQAYGEPGSETGALLDHRVG